MKKFLLSILLVAIGLSVFSQPATRILNMRPAYPLAVGEATVDSLVYAHNGLILQDIVQDSLPTYEIGHIFAQTVRYTEEGHGFYVKADSLHSNNVEYSMDVDSLPVGPIEFNSSTGRFKYYPAAEDYRTFFVTFRATNGADTVVEVVEFNLMAHVAPEEYAFQTQGVMPDGKDYTIIAETKTTMFLNYESRTAYSYSISGKIIVFDNNVQNKVWGLSGREDIYELNIYAEKLYIRSALEFPQTNITIYAKEIIFEDQNGMISGINVSPYPISTTNIGNGQNGANAGNITLYVKKMTGNLTKRFILNGAKGQNTNDTIGDNHVPGNGGNGGIMVSNINIENYCDFARGGGGLKFNIVAHGNLGAGEIIGAGSMGVPGHFELQPDPYIYLHPNYISAVMRYVNDAFVNNYTTEVFQICQNYYTEIDEYLEYYDCDTCHLENAMALNHDIMEIQSILYKINQGLDYFGNPIGWVPLLSFEVMLTNYDNEIDRAIPTLYMYYWLNQVDQSLQKLVVSSLFAASEKEQSIQDNEALINQLVSEIPALQNLAIDIQGMIDSLEIKIEILKEQLMAKARHNVKKRNRIAKAAGICKAVANVLPVFGPVGATISTGINTVLSTGVIDYLSEGVNYSSAVKEIGDVSCDTNFFSRLQSSLSSVGAGITNLNFDSINNAFKSLSKTVGPLITNITKVSKLLSSSSTPSDQVTAEFNRLKAESAEWNSLNAEFERLSKEKILLINMIQKNSVRIETALSDITEDVLSLDAFRRDAFVGNSKRDLNAMQYLEKMEQRAKNRLLKYHYYLRKAYEYRLLKPYQGEFNLVGMFERFESLGMALDSVIDANAYATLKSVFREVISDMAEEIIDEYSNNMPEQTAPITIVIPREQLDILNANEIFTLNFYEMGIFSPDEENVRIVDLGIQHLETHVVGNVGYSGYMDLNLTHQGTSRFRKDGQIYWFDHMSRTTTNPHTWGVRYDAISNASTNIQPSYASSSLLYSILNNNSSTNMMLFSRPSAWGDINISKKVHTSGGADIVIDSLVLRLQYDFTTRPSNIRNIDITTNDDLLPYIACSEVDRNGRSNGNGNLNRSYNVSNQTVSFSAIEKYGTWHFVNWTDRSGNIVSDTMDLTVNRSTDQFYRANYERRVPILSVPDTIFVNNAGGIYNVSVANVGSGDLEMDWYVSDSLSTWVHLNGLVEGIDNGNFSFTYEDYENGSYRLDSLEIFAPETDVMSKMIYIVQNSSTCNLTANVTPSSVIICEGDTATITASGQSSSGNIFSYSWNTGETTSSVNVLSGGERTVTVIDSNGCTATASVNVIVRPTPNVAISGNTTFCFGEISSLTASGGNSYHWSNGSTSNSTSVSQSGVYTVTATNAEGCSNTASVTVTLNPLPNVNISGNNGFCEGSNVSLTATGANNYSWSNGSNSNLITVSNPGTYTVIGTDVNGCSATASKTVSVNSSYQIQQTHSICQGEIYNFNGQYLNTAGTYTQSLSSVNGCDSTIILTLIVKSLPTPSILGSTTICQGQTTTLTAAGGNSYSWSNGSTSSNVTISQSGIYTVTATNVEGCSATTNVTVTVNPLPNVNITGNTSFCQGDNTTLMATGASTYAWSNSQSGNAITVSNAGTYTVTGTDANGCSNTATKTVSVNPTYNIPLTHSICQGESYNFHGQNITTAGTYTHTLQTVNGCDSVLTLTLTVKPLPVPTISGTTTLCQGQNTTLTANGGNSYAWSNGSTSSNVTVSQSGVYTVTATNAEGCSASTNVTVTVNPLPNVNITGDSSFCQGNTTTLTATGASTYAWSNSSTDNAITVNNAGTYTVTGTDANGCSNTATKTVSVNPTYNIPLTHSICQGESYNFYGQNLTTAGTYTHTLQTVNGCDSVLTLTLTVKPLPTPTISGNTTLCQGQTTTLTANGGVSYLWSDGSTNNNINVSQSGVYTVTATNVEGCTASTSVTVTVNPLPTVTIAGDTTICAGNSTNLTASGADTYSWSTGDNTASATISAFGIYNVTGTSVAGCSSVASVTVLVSQLPIITITGETDICAGESTTLTANGGTTYLWSNGTTDAALTVSTPGTWQVIGYNEAGCNAMTSATVNVWQPAATEFSVEYPDSCYTWNDIDYCTSGDYTQTLQTVHGCDSVITLHLTITVGVDNYDGFDFKVYPNPTSNIVNVECIMKNEEWGNVELYLCDAYGRLLDVVRANNHSPLQTAQIDLSRYANGIYFVKAVAEGKVVAVRKVVKE